MGLATTIRQWQSTWRQAHELGGLEQDQREALARDIGVPHDVLVRFAARGAEAGAELPRLMEALSLDVGSIERKQTALLRDMSVTCTECAAVTRCRRDLDQGRASSNYGSYCPNADTLRELQG